MVKGFKLDTAGLGAVLKGPEMQAMVNDAAQRIASGARGRAPASASVVVESGATDRATAKVIVKHPRAAGLERKNGIMIPAARSIGAEVRGK